ncbi:MAG: sodium-dependent bicarbonate transport family permease [Deltaproteobacteria bacterium]|nr:sodium-dependent bicarbonate transport family permease [Deltaproteobacteria bacterium]
MAESNILQNFLSPPVLFFFLGLLATLAGSDLEIPQPLPKFLSLYLLLAIGFKGGLELHHSGLNTDVLFALGAAMIMAIVVPLYSYFILRIKLSVYDAAAIAATYGSISAVTFITAISYLNNLGISYGGHMVAAMALMKSPAIVIGVILVRGFSQSTNGNGFAWKPIIHEAFFNGSVFLIIGALVIGLATGDEGAKALKPFTDDIFKGMLSFFLLDMGIVAAKRLGDLGSNRWFLTGFGVLMPVANAILAIFIARLLGLSEGDALLFAILCASASYIAVPAAMRLAVPQANPSLYVAMALAITFPFNIIVGIPLYHSLIERLGS